MLNPVSKGLEELLALATELERVHEIYTTNDIHRGYHQDIMFHYDLCGTPACAWGHYMTMRGLLYSPDGILCAGPAFGISFCEINEIFGVDGCNRAKTALEAATYIRSFIARKLEVLANGG